VNKRTVGLLLLSVLLYSSIVHGWETYNTDIGYLTILEIRNEIKAYLLNNSYSPRQVTTHPWITIRALKYLEDSDSSWNVLTPDEKSMIASGSIEEDFDMVGSSDSNHVMYTHIGEGSTLGLFYPVQGSGVNVEAGFDRAYNHYYTGGYDINNLDSIVGRLDYGGPSDRTNAIYWALNSTINYRNLRYIRDNPSLTKMQKLHILGNIIHLLEDMASPPHPNGDPHPLQHSEETALNKIGFSDQGNFGGSVSIPDTLPSYLTLPTGAEYWQYFEYLSKFTREYFFSEDRMFKDWHVSTLRDGQGARGEKIINYKYPYFENGFRGYYIYTSMGRKLARYNHLLGYTALLNGDYILASTWDEAKTFQLYIDEYVSKDSWRELWPITVKYVAGFTKDFYTKEILSSQQPSTVQVSQVSAGLYHTVAVKSDGTVWAWGYNNSGQIGDGTTTDRLTPVQVSGLTGVIAVSAGDSHTVAVKSDGTVWAWGWNSAGQLGDGTITDRMTPVQVAGLTGVFSVSASHYHTVAVKSDGTVWAWGANNYGQIGDGTTAHRLTPVQVSGLTGVIAVSAGSDHAVALKSDGTVWAWGRNTEGQLGDGTMGYRMTPVQVVGLTGVFAVSAGFYNTFAVKSDGTVWAWGWNNLGQLGDGTTAQRLTPVQVSGLTGVVTVSAGGDHAVALKSDGTVWAWGRNAEGQLGDGTQTWRMAPVQVVGLTGVFAVSGGDFWHNVVLKNDGTVWTWGRNNLGQLGDGTTTDRLTPVKVKMDGADTIIGTVAAPTFSPAPGLYVTEPPVSLSTTTPGASIRYTTDGSTPTASYGAVYSGPFSVVSTATIRAVAYLSGWTTSSVSIGTYTIQPPPPQTVSAPTFSPTPTTYAAAQSVYLSTATSGATIRYTTDGSTPTASYGTVYSGPISVSSSMTIRAVAYLSGWATSPVSTGAYTITGTEPPPTNYTLTVNAANGTVVKNPNQTSYASGTSVQLTATANSGYTFTGWSGDITGTANPVTVTMNSNKTITANFTLSSTITSWTKTFGGTGLDVAYAVQQTTDSGYIVAGLTTSFGAGASDAYLIKTDASGNTLWTKTFGGTFGDELASAVQQTTDGGYIVAGGYSIRQGNRDAYLIKTDANGNTLWTKTFGETNDDLANAVRQTTDGGYIVAGYTTSFGTIGGDAFLIKTDASGNTLWTKTFGGTNGDLAQAVQQTTDGGYIVAGFTKSFGAGNWDAYLIKTDASGNTLWTKTFGGTGDDQAYAVQQTTDGGYIVAGLTNYSDAISGDAFLIKTDANGNTLWTKTFGGTNHDYIYGVQQTTDGGYIVAGLTLSFGAGASDVYLIKTDANGNILWTKTFGGTNNDYAHAVQQTTDGGYIVAGITYSFGAIGGDVYLIKTDASGNVN
jgi:uncharacterized repeat protein (TIGR02543 family)